MGARGLAFEAISSKLRLIEDLPSHLSGVQTKLDRAYHHLADAKAMAETLLAAYQAAVVLEPSKDGSEVAVRLGDVPDLPARFSAIVGDFFHNVRSTLDHLAWQLVLRHGLEPTRRTAFPIHLTAPENGLHVVPGVSNDALAAIEKVQPFNWHPDEPEKSHLSPLAVVALLNNIDKHRTPLVGVAVLTDGSWSSNLDQTIKFTSANHRALGSGDDVGVFRIAPAGSPLRDVRLGFALRLLDDHEAAVYAPFDLVDWAMVGTIRYVEFAVFRRLLPLFE